MYPRGQQISKSSLVIGIVVGGLLGVGITAACMSFVVFTKTMAILDVCLEAVRNGQSSRGASYLQLTFLSIGNAC
jgi:hypothetical protein